MVLRPVLTIARRFAKKFAPEIFMFGGLRPGLPAPITDLSVYERVPSPFKWNHSVVRSLRKDVFFSLCAPHPLKKDRRLISFSKDCAEMLGVTEEQVKSEGFLKAITGNALFEGSEPYALAYAGHQFGSYNPTLGDGRAISLGECDAPGGHRFDIQLKGSGRTPYSRTFDGRAVLRSTIREFLCSEAMHHLGIPTTRALCLAETDDPIIREEVETAAVLVRVAPSHFRFGNFELFHYRDQPENVKKLADYLINEYFRDWAVATKQDNPYNGMFEMVVKSTAQLMAQWQSVGFVHGVMNTDNMSILGLTIDYGPFAFMEGYDPFFAPNHTDESGRYSYTKQPHIGLWNLKALASALQCVTTTEGVQKALMQYEPYYNEHYMKLMRAKLGIVGDDTDISEILLNLLFMMRKHRADFTSTFRLLCEVPVPIDRTNMAFIELGLSLGADSTFDKWIEAYSALVSHQCQTFGVTDEERRRKMRRANPKYILRTASAQMAIDDAHQRNYQTLEDLLYVLQSPFDDHGERYERFAIPTKGESNVVLSCSS